MKISFYDEHGKLSYNPNTELNVGVGGGERIIIQTAKALATKGHDVSVYIRCNFPDIYDGVKYYMYHDYRPHDEDILVGFENFPVSHSAKKTVNWVNRFYTSELERFSWVDKFVVLSDWQRDYFASLIHPDLIKKTVVINPGVEEGFFTPREKQPFNITYTGSPQKGAMPALIPVYERLKTKLPEARIHVYGGGGLWGWDNEQYRPIYDKLIRAGVLYHGQIGKDDVMHRLGQAQIFLYPVGAHHKETFCLAVLEAMAAGCVVIASESGNVKNLVGDRGYVIPGDINHYAWSIEAVQKITQLYSDPGLMDRLSTASRDFARNYTWENTAIQFEQFVISSLFS